MINNFKFRQFVYRCLKPFVILNDWRISHLGIYNGRKVLKKLGKPAADTLVSEMILSGDPFSLVRYGHTEFCCLMDVGRKRFWRDKLSSVHSDIFNDWKALYLEASKQIDILAVWNYKSCYSAKKRLLRQLPNINHLVALEDLFPFDNGWVHALQGKKVLVIHPFVKTIEMQYSLRETIGILPELGSIQLMKPVVHYCAPDEKFDWIGALESMKKEVSTKEFDVALLGCGPYGLPLACYIKELGRQAIHLGGMTQLYFGIKGRRWEKMPHFAKHFDDNWIFPLKEDIHPYMWKVENGCYVG